MHECPQKELHIIGGDEEEICMEDFDALDEDFDTLHSDTPMLN